MSEQTTRRRADRGQTLALFAVLLPGLLALVAVGIDSSNLFLRYRDAQSAADLASLAGARLLPTSPTAADRTAARDRALAVASTNGFSTGVTATTPYDGDDSKLEVEIATTADTYFARLLGLLAFDVEVRAVAESEWSASGGTFPAVFAGCQNPTGCNKDSGTRKLAIDWSGSDGNSIIGGMHSNCGIKGGGSDNSVIGETGYGGGSNCPLDISGSNNTYDPPPAPAPNMAFPVSYTFSDFTCDVTRTGKLELKNYYQSGTRTIVPGTYCATGSNAEIILGDGNVTGNVTLVVYRGSAGCGSGGKAIEISGSNFNLTAYDPTRVLMWTNVGGSEIAVKISGSDGTWGGLIVAPCGQVEISGQATSTSGGGSILADWVKIGGSDVHIDSTGLDTLGPPALVKLRLLE